MSIALVTGASRGIGRACALALAKRGYDVAVNYVSNEAAAQAVVAEIQALGVRSLAVRANTAELPEVKDMFRTVVREMGGLDVLVNNAGVVDDRYLMMLTEDSLTRLRLMVISLSNSEQHLQSRMDKCLAMMEAVCSEEMVYSDLEFINGD
mgnify:CR=1 FL=1